MVATARLDSARAGAPARRDDPRPHRDRSRLPGRRQAPRPPGRGRGAGGGGRRGGDARRHRPSAAARGGRGGPLGGADRAREGRDRPRPRHDAGAEGLGERPGHRRAHRRRRGAARAAAAGGAERRAGGERALLRDAARRRLRRGDRDLRRGGAGAGARRSRWCGSRAPATARRWWRCPRRWSARSRAAGAEAELWSEPGRRYPVRLRELSPVADAATRTYEARFTLPADAEPALGMSATVTLAPAAGRPTVVLPTSALIDTGSGPSVWVVGADDRLEARPVVVAGYAAGSARIASRARRRRAGGGARRAPAAGRRAGAGDGGGGLSDARLQPLALRGRPPDADPLLHPDAGGGGGDVLSCASAGPRTRTSPSRSPSSRRSGRAPPPPRCATRSPTRSRRSCRSCRSSTRSRPTPPRASWRRR